MTSNSECGKWQCTHEQCEKSIGDVSPHYRDMETGNLFCSKDHLLAKANGDDIDE